MDTENKVADVVNAEAGTEAAPETVKNIIEVPNPTEEQMKGIMEHVKVNFNFDVNPTPTTFNFKRSIDKETGIETIRKPVTLAIPYPSVNGIVKILETGGKQLELLIEAVEGIVNAAARDILNDDGGTTLDATNFPYDKLSWEFISNLPKETRRGGGIPKETWEAFYQDYVEIMPGATGKTVAQVANAAKILIGKLNAVRTAEPILQLLVEQLAIYSEASPNIEDYKECVAFLLKKADTYLNVTEEQLLANL